MSRTVVNRQFFDLDMVNISNIKKDGLVLKNTIVYVNSALFMSIKNCALQMALIYEAEGIIEQAWQFIKSNKYKEAEVLFDKILEVSSSCKAYFGKFTVCLLQDKEAYPYLKKAIETKTDNYYDDYYHIYLVLYNVLLELEDDFVPLLELLREPKKVIAFSKNSYNGRYLEFTKLLNDEDFEGAKKALDKCLEMKEDFNLSLAKILLEQTIKYQKKLKKAYEKQELELEKQRSIVFAQAVKDKDLKGAKKALENILNFRNQENKDNYIYYLFLELIETIEMIDNDIAFEIMPVNYSYSNKQDILYTFFEAIGAGDFLYALETGKKCRGKLLDSKQKSIKVNLYVILLEMIFDKLELRKNNIDNLYQTLIGNIERGNYKHALSIYNDNSVVLKEYNNRLIKYLFERLMNKSTPDEDLIIDEFTDEEAALEEEKLADEIPIADVIEVEESEAIVEESESTISMPKLEVSQKNNSVTIFLRHNEPNNEYFHKYQVCLVNKRFEEAKTWLDSFAEVLRQNGISKRLDYYYYQIGLGILELSYPEDVVYQRKQMYFLAYNAILDGKYEDALIYLNYYNETDQINDIRGYLLLGRLYTLMKKNNKAIETYIKANAMAPSPDAYYFLGELYYKKHCWSDAVFCYLTYNEFYPKENPTVYLNLSECYKHLNKSDKVVKYLKIADEINIEQNHGLYLKDRILKAEMIDKKRREHFLLNKENKGDLTVVDS